METKKRPRNSSTRNKTEELAMRELGQDPNQGKWLIKDSTRVTGDC